MPRLKDKVVLVTGAAGAIGAAIAQAIDAEGGTAIRSDLAGRGDVADALDVTVESDWARITAVIADTHGRLDGLVNAAGIVVIGTVEDTDFATWRRVLAINLDGAFLTLQAAMRAIRSGGKGGAIVITASAAGLRAEPGIAAYGASKAAVIHLARIAAKDGAPVGIRVNAVAPGGVETPIWQNVPFFQNLVESTGSEAGAFKATEIVNEGWRATLAAAHALNAKTILFQCPASFKQTAENIASMEKFFCSIDRRDLNLCWEPRGDWDRAVVRSLCVSLELCHVVDPFIGKTMTPYKYYFRLHGRSGWRYQYEPGELKELATSVVKSERGYVFFNNSKMTEDALKFCKVLNDRNE